MAHLSLKLYIHVLRNVAHVATTYRTFASTVSKCVCLCNSACYVYVSGNRKCPGVVQIQPFKL